MSDSKKQQPSLLPAYLAVGDDALKRTAVMKRLRARLSALGDLSFNSDVFEGDVACGSDIVAACETVPFASPVRLVEVRAADKLKKADSEAIVAYLKKPSPTTVLALTCDKLAKNTRLYKAIAACGKSAVIDCATPKAADLPRLVRSMAVGHGVTFSEGAARAIVDLIGEDTVRLDAEIAKIALAHQGNAAVSERDVSALVSRAAEAKPWDFVDAFSQRDIRACLDVRSRLGSTSPHALMAQCATRVRELICARAMIDRGNPAAVSSALNLGKRAWLAKKYVAWARGFSAKELRSALISARDAERAMKSGSDPDAAFLEWALSVMCRSAR